MYQILTNAQPAVHLTPDIPVHSYTNFLLWEVFSHITISVLTSVLSNASLMFKPLLHPNEGYYNKTSKCNKTQTTKYF